MQSNLRVAESTERLIDVQFMGELGDNFLESYAGSGCRVSALRETAKVAMQQGLRPCAIKRKPERDAFVAFLHLGTGSIFVISMQGVALEQTVPEGTSWQALNGHVDLDAEFGDRIRVGSGS